MKTNRVLCWILVIAASVAVQVQAQSFLTNGLVAYYPFNGNGNDASGNSINLTNNNASFIVDRFGSASNAMAFNGYSSWLATTNPFPIGGNSSRTISFWMNIPLIQTRQVLNWGGTGGGPVWSAVYIFAGDKFGTNNSLGSFVLTGNYVGAFFNPVVITTNTWHHVVVVYSGDITTTRCYLDGNGMTINSIANQDGSILNTTTNSPLYVGVNPTLGIDTNPDGDWYTPFWGALDDVRIYNRALSSSEVVQLYALNVPPAPQIIQDLTNIFVLYGQSAALSVGASSTNPISYQWYFNASNGGGRAAAYAEIAGGFTYGAVVTNGGYGYGNVPAVSFVGGGGSGAAGYATISNGVVTGITVTNAGGGYSSPPSVVIGVPNGYLYGQTNSILTISNASQNSVGNYYVVVSNANGGVTSSVVTLTVLYPPSLTAQPADAYTTAYNPASFTIAAVGTQPLAYQWQFSGTNLVNATNNFLIITNVEQGNIGQYLAVITNAYGSITSSVANLFMYPYLCQPFAGLDTYWGQTNILSVGAWGSGNLSYQWYFNGATLAGATSATLLLGGIQFTNAGLYSVVVSSILGSVTNAPYQVVVNPANVALGLFAGVIIQGTVGYNYTIQGSTNLSDPNAWITLTNITLTAPVQIWDDHSSDVHNPSVPHKFYQVIAGQ